MTGQDVFIAASRVFGLWVLYNSISWFFAFIEHLLPIEQPPNSYAPGTILLQLIWHIPLMVLLLFKTESLARAVGYGGVPEIAERMT